MEFLGKLSLWIHIITGVVTLIAGPIALYYNKNNRLHKLAGKVFFYAMCIVVATSILAFFKRPTVIFFQFLLGIGILVGYHTIRGVRAILFMKGVKTPTSFDTQWGWMAIASGLAMMGAAVYYYLQGVNIAFPILFGVFGLGSFVDGRYYVRLLNVENLDKRFWFQLHLNSMFGAFVASTTAFAVNAADFAPWYIQWFAPTIIMIPLQIHLMRQRKVTKKDLGSPFEPKPSSALTNSNRNPVYAEIDG